MFYLPLRIRNLKLELNSNLLPRRSSKLQLRASNSNNIFEKACVLVATETVCKQPDTMCGMTRIKTAVCPRWCKQKEDLANAAFGRSDVQIKSTEVFLLTF